MAAGGLIHGDFHPNNMAFREEEGQELPLLFDWQISTYGSSGMCDMNQYLAQANINR